MSILSNQEENQLKNFLHYHPIMHIQAASRFRSSNQTYSISELSQSNQNANNNKPPSWLKTFLEAQSESQRQMQQIIK